MLRGILESILGNVYAEGPLLDSDLERSRERYPIPKKYLDNPELIPKYYSFQSNLVTDEDLQPGMLRQLEVDKRLTLPTRTHIRFLVTATDVLHSWSVPSLGIKVDAVPGRLTRINTFILREGVFYGQCSEMCGTLHGFMPIVVEAVSPEKYAEHAKKYYQD
ncbi:Cytochrome C oxidase subunit II periplasmic domain protein [Theileria parva strain Muguga]|uniref:Cytochrome C oxidase subunit II periplasmic domain protein n=1 Tax=Theileria parva strain Muguga TaxID=333668 RepID=UPI001C621B26|nr:Cytochrome C oxidase subunit II periplasmic domain protein [Theileria parva strain Muguga]KAF5153424.1 Cytochrome C oxidase subunit II periplasmic domain protein [Theileria parva strain Muguga]